MKKKTLLTSILAIVMCFSLITGATFALFTSEDKVNIAVTSGEVSVSATVENFEYKTLNQDWTAVSNNQTTFDNIGGSAVLNGNQLTLDKIVPGDGVKFDIKVTNDSDVTVKYRTAIRNVSEDDTLFNALDVSVNTVDFSSAKISDWSILTPSVVDVETISLVIELPEGAEGAQLMNETAKLQITVEIIQGNAETTNDIPVSTKAEFMNAIASAENTNETVYVALKEDFDFDAAIEINGNVVIKGEGQTIERSAGYTGNIFTVKTGSSLTLEGVVVDGGAIWEDQTAGASTMSLRTYSVATSYGVKDKVNNGVVATDALVKTEGNAVLTLGEDAVLANNDGANAVSLATRGGGKLIISGAKIINNRSAAGAIWGGDDIEINEGSVINGNHATSIGGAIRMVNGNGAIIFTMNGGEMNYNTSATTGGAIWGGNNATYYFNGGEMAFNSAEVAGGAIWTGTYENYYFSGDFKMHDNTAGELGGAIRFSDHASLTMTGGHVYNNTVNGVSSAFYLNNNSATLSGGIIDDNFSYSGGLSLTDGGTEVNGTITFGLSTNHNTVYLAEGFNGFKFTTNVNVSNFAQFNFKPYDGYVYTEGDEDKLVCTLDGYETYWDAASGLFKLQAK